MENSAKLQLLRKGFQPNQAKKAKWFVVAFQTNPNHTFQVKRCQLLSIFVVTFVMVSAWVTGLDSGNLPMKTAK